MKNEDSYNSSLLSIFELLIILNICFFTIKLDNVYLNVCHT